MLVDPSGRAIAPSADAVVDLTERGAVVLSHFHHIAQKLEWAIVCQVCGQPVQGYNSGNERYLSVRCGCREYKAEISPAVRGRL